MSRQLVERTKAFGEAVIRFGAGLPRNSTTDVIWRQLLRSALSVGANYRAACIARSRSEFIAKLHIAREEADETQYWIDLIKRVPGVSAPLADLMLKEACELTAILTASITTAKDHQSVSGRSA